MRVLTGLLMHMHIEALQPEIRERRRKKKAVIAYTRVVVKSIRINKNALSVAL